jgi:hypothetical protein
MISRSLISFVGGKLMKALLATVFLALTVSASPITQYMVGYEDTTGHSSDNDFNDLMVSGNGITLYQLGGVWSNLTPAVSLANSGTPFWDHVSYDGNFDNFGDCLQGLGTGVCSTPVNDDHLQYLATLFGGKVDNVWFTGTGTISLLGGISADPDKIGVCGVGLFGGCTTTIEWLTGSTLNVGIVGPWEFVAYNGSAYSYSDPTFQQAGDFAFARGTEMPEPGGLLLMGLGLLIVGGWKFQKENHAKRS